MGARLLLATLASLLTSCAWFRPDPPEYEPLTRASGLVLQDLVVPDEGLEVVAGDAVALQYELWLADRTQLETSRQTGHPLRFVVGDGSVPAGVEQGVLGMRLFGRRRLSVPSALGFGSAGRPPRIPPDTDLLFEIELIEHAPREPAQGRPPATERTATDQPSAR